MKIILLTILLLSNFAPLARADNIPLKKSYKIKSNNEAYFSWLTFADSSSHYSSYKRRWFLRVYTYDSSLIWKQPIWHIKSPDGVLSNDGAYFCIVNHWYNPNEPIVGIYRKDKQPILIKGNQFKIPVLKTQLNISNYLWLGDSPSYYVDEFINKLIIDSGDYHTWSINLETGEIKSSESNQSGLVIIFIFTSIVLYYLIKIGAKELLSSYNPKE